MGIFQPSNVRCMLELWPKVQRTRALCSRCVAHNNAALKEKFGAMISVFARIDFMIVTRDRAWGWDWFVICCVVSVCHRAKQNIYGAKSQPPVNFALLSLFWWLVRLVIKSEPLKPILESKLERQNGQPSPLWYHCQNRLPELVHSWVQSLHTTL